MATRRALLCFLATVLFGIESARACMQTVPGDSVTTTTQAGMVTSPTTSTTTVAPGTGCTMCNTDSFTQEPDPDLNETPPTFTMMTVNGCTQYTATCAFDADCGVLIQGYFTDDTSFTLNGGMGTVSTMFMCNGMSQLYFSDDEPTLLLKGIFCSSAC